MEKIYLSNLSENLESRRKIIQEEINYVQWQSNKRYNKDNPDILLSLQKQYEKYTSELEKLNSLINFYEDTYYL